MTVDPMKIIQLIQQGQNPQQLMMAYLQNSLGSTPIGQNLISLAKNNDSKGIESIVRNIYQSKGMDYDKTFNALASMLKIK